MKLYKSVKTIGTSVALSTCLISSVMANEEAIEELQESLYNLEDNVYSLEDKVGSRVVHPFEGDINMGGFFHTTYTHIKARDRTVASFDRQNFELLLSGNIAPRWTFFFAGGFLRESDDPFSRTGVTTSRFRPSFNRRNKNPHIIGWSNFNYTDALQIRIGRFITPHGIINIEHFPATLRDPEQPLFLRPFSGNTILPNFVTGLQVHGSKFMGDNLNHQLGYALYAAGTEGADRTADNTNVVEKHVVGGRFYASFMNKMFTFGVNAARGTRDNADVQDTFKMRGLDFEFDKDRFFFKSEFYRTNDKSQHKRRAFYWQPAFRITDQWIAFYRNDYLHTGLLTTGAVKENLFGLNYLPVSNIRLRLTYKTKKFDKSRDGLLDATTAKIWQLSGTFSF